MENFKRLEVTGSTEKEAFAKAPFTISRDATQAYRNWVKKQEAEFTADDEKQFMLNYVTKFSKGCPGIGFAITLQPAVVNTRREPYALKDVKNQSGTRKYTKVFQLIDTSNNAVLAEVAGTKPQAKEAAKNLYRKGFKGNLKVKFTKQILDGDGENVAFEMEYVPSKGTQEGKYLVFGVEKD